MIQDIGTVPYHREQKRRFREEGLWQTWADRYPQLFDELDREQARNQAHLGFKFHEWFGAIVLHHATGFSCLLSKYGAAKHVSKQRVLRALMKNPAAFELMCNRSAAKKRYGFGGRQCPDLLMFAPDQTDWFLCEVKGPKDRLRKEQVWYFDALAAACKKPVYPLHLREVHL